MPMGGCVCKDDDLRPPKSYRRSIPNYWDSTGLDLGGKVISLSLRSPVGESADRRIGTYLGYHFRGYLVPRGRNPCPIQLTYLAKLEGVQVGRAATVGEMKTELDWRLAGIAETQVAPDDSVNQGIRLQGCALLARIAWHDFA